MTLSSMRISRFVGNRFTPASSADSLMSNVTEASLSSIQPSNLHAPSNLAIASDRIRMEYRTGGQVQTVLQDINLSIQSGTIQLLMGPSGSGKTTLLSILGGILSPTDGHVSLLNTNITQLSSRKLAEFRLHNIGFIFQGFNLFDALTATENIVVALKMKGVKARQARQEAHYWLEQVGLGDKANHRPPNLSGGQKQRVAIARALAGNPPLIMADEPTAALDSHSGQAVIEMLCTLAKENNRTVLMVTHDPRIKRVADQVTYLEDGQLQPADTLSEPKSFPPVCGDTWPKSA